MISLIAQFVVVFALPIAALAQAEPSGEIREIDSGACWAQGSVDQGAWKITSFNDNQNFYALQDQFIPSDDHKLATKLTEKLKAHFPKYVASPIRVHLHCSGAGHQLLISIDHPKFPACAWAKKSVDSNVSFDIHTLLPNPNVDPASACYGVAPASFLFVVKDGVDPELLAKHLSRKYRSSVKSVKVSKVLGYVQAQFVERFAFREREMRAFLMNDRKTVEKVRKIEFDGAVITSGEELLLLNDQFPGY